MKTSWFSQTSACHGHRILLVLVWAGFFLCSGNAQDPIFSQFQNSKQYLNPAYTGIDGGWSVTAVEREQWGKVLHDAPLPGTFSSQFASVEWNLPNYLNSLGLFFMNDTEGEGRLRTVYSGFNYSQVLAVGRPKRGGTVSNVRLGFGLYYARKWIDDWEDLLFSDQLHPKGPAYFLSQSAHAPFFEQFQNNPPWWTGLNIGVLYAHQGRSGERWEMGVSSTHVIGLLSSSEVESIQAIGTSLAPRFTLHGTAFIPSWQFGSRDHFTPFPSARIDYQGRISAFTIGSELWMNAFAWGLFYQSTLANTFSTSTHALIFTTSVGVGVHDDHVLDIGLSYDLNLGGLTGYTGGVFEVTINYHNRNYRNNVTCPPVTRAHRLRYENSFHKNPKNKNLN